MTLSSEHERTSSLSPSAPPSGTAATPTDAWNIFPSTARQQIRQQASHLRRRLLQKAGRQSCHFQHRARVRLFEPRYRSWYTAGGILWRTQFGTPEIVGSRYKHSCSDCRIQTRVSFSYTAYSGLPQSHQMTSHLPNDLMTIIFQKNGKKVTLTRPFTTVFCDLQRSILLLKNEFDSEVRLQATKKSMCVVSRITWARNWRSW